VLIGGERRSGAGAVINEGLPIGPRLKTEEVVKTGENSMVLTTE